MTNRVLTGCAAAFLIFAPSCADDDNADPATKAVASAEPEAVRPADLRAEVSGEREKAFYEARGWKAAWSGEPARALIDALKEAQLHALDSRPYLEEIAGAKSVAGREAALTRAALTYADALADGVADPRRLQEVYTIPVPKVDIVSDLNRAVAGGEVKEWLAGLAPQDEEYRALSEAYLKYRMQAAQERRRSIASGESIKEGASDPRVPQLAQALASNGYIGSSAVQGNVYTAEMADAVRRLQADYGLASDGVVGPDTLEILNAGAAERARQLAINLERRRWLERKPPETRIDVNTAAAFLDYLREGAQVDQRRVVVGQPGWETPPLQSPIFRLVANPTWTVPKSIEEEEIAPKGEAYLRQNNMVRRDGWIVQLPGPDNALGGVKFDMRNGEAIYLHDTPAKSLFNRSQRHASHGCIRVEDALGFARLIAEHGGKASEFDEASLSGEETFVRLDDMIPVRLLYHTAFVDRGGRIVFRTDPYGWDDGVAEAIGLSNRARRQLRTHVGDVGP